METQPTFYTAADIDTIYKKNGPKFVSLQDGNGKFVILKNNKSISVDDRYKEIKKAITGTSLLPGIYYYCEQNTVRDNAAVTKYPVKIGNPIQAPLSEPEKIETVWTAAKALEILSEKNRLELENQQLKAQINQLETEIDLLEDEIEQAQNLSETAQQTAVTGNIWNQLVPLGTALVEKIMANQDKKLALMEKMVLSKPPVNNFNPFIMTDEQVINHFQQLIDTGNQEKLNQDLDILKNVNPGLYNALYPQIYGNQEQSTVN